MLISIIIPVLNEPKENIEELYGRIKKVCYEKFYNYEVIFVDDGSSNNILDFLKILRHKDKRIKILAFDRNYGQPNAFLAGLCYAKGDSIVFMDADLQYCPEEIPLFIEKINQGYDAVGGRRKKDSIGFFSKILTGCLNIMWKIKSTDYGCSFNAMKKEVALGILSMGFPLCIKPLAVKLAQNKIEIDVTHNKRKYGKSSYSFIGYVFLGFKYLFFFLRAHKKQKLPPFKITLCMVD